MTGGLVLLAVWWLVGGVGWGAGPSSEHGMHTAAAFDNTPQAVDDVFTMDAAFAGVSTPQATFILDVMANDRGGKAKSLYSIDNGVNDASPANDLLTMDRVGVSEKSFRGADISITADGKISYVPSAEMTAALTDSFTYAIKLGNGALSWATATITITGVNHAPTDIVFSVEAPPSGTTTPVIVAHLAAVDEDVGDSATFSIVAQSVLLGAADTFTVNGNALVDGLNSHGNCRLDGCLDSYDITLRVTDSHGASYDEHVFLTFGTNIINPGDTIVGATGTDIIYALGNGTGGSVQHDNVHAGSGDDVIFGQDGKDNLFGEDGNDILHGGLGLDTLTGGEGSDIFQFSSITDSTPNLFLADVITDFLHGTDLIDLSAIHGVGDVPLTVADNITWSEVGADTIIQIDTTGDTTPDMTIRLTGTSLNLDAQDFKL